MSENIELVKVGYDVSATRFLNTPTPTVTPTYTFTPVPTATSGCAGSNSRNAPAH